MSTYQPGRQSKEYHRLSRKRRGAIILEVNRRFREKTGVTRQLHRTARRDQALRHTWLRIRDAVMEEREQKQIDEDMEFRRELFLMDMPEVVIADMEQMGWSKAAELLETWTSRPPAIAPQYSAPITDLIKMDWVLGFARAKRVFDKLVKDRIWTDAASQKRIAQLFKSRTAGSSLGDLSKPATLVDKNWINSRSVTGGLSFDPLAGALGAFELKVAIAGTVQARGFGLLQVSIREVGVYVKDSFDFNGRQFLGVWGHRDEPVSNADFREWRKQNNAGGDFRVYSNVKRIKRNPPDVVTTTL